MDLYKREYRLTNAERLVKTAPITNDSKTAILRFGDHLFAQARGQLTVEKKLRMLRILAEAIGDLETAQTENIEKFFSMLNRQASRSSWSKRAYILTVREFYKWLGMDSKVRNLKPIRGKSKVPQLLSQEDIIRMVGRTYHIRDKAMVAGLYDLGGRVGEWFADLCTGDFVFEDKIEEDFVEVAPEMYRRKKIITRTCMVSVSGKTGARTVGLELNGSAELIEAWIAKHPDSENPKAYMWVRDNGLPLFRSYEQVLAHLRKLAESAGIHKHITTNSFRHSRMTAIDKVMRETFIKTRHGTSQLKTYIHPDARV